MKELIGKKVKAIGSCGSYKNKEVIGELTSQGRDHYIVLVPTEDEVTVYSQTIQEVK